MWDLKDEIKSCMDQMNGKRNKMDQKLKEFQK